LQKSKDAQEKDEETHKRAWKKPLQSLKRKNTDNGEDAERPKKQKQQANVPDSSLDPNDTMEAIFKNADPKMKPVSNLRDSMTQVRLCHQEVDRVSRACWHRETGEPRSV